MRIFVLRKKVWTAVGCLILAAGMFWAVNSPAAVGAAAATRQLPIYCVQPAEGEKNISISFDAAWGADDTDRLIEILGKYNVKATFFLVGQWVDTYPEEVRKLAEAGHEVMNHSDTHPYFTKCSTESILKEIETCNDKIEALTGVRPTLIRCPYGDYDDHVSQCGALTGAWSLSSGPSTVWTGRKVQLPPVFWSGSPPRRPRAASSSAITMQNTPRMHWKRF